LHGEAGEDLAMWIRTPLLEDAQLEKLGCAHQGDAPNLAPSCFVASNVPDELQEADHDEEQEQLPSEVLPRYLRVENDLSTDHSKTSSCSHVSTRRLGSGEWLARVLGLKANVTVVRTKEEVETFIEVLQCHLQDNKKVDWEALATAFNRKVLERPLGCSMKFKNAVYLKQYGEYLTKRVQVDQAQQERLKKVSNAIAYTM